MKPKHRMAVKRVEAAEMISVSVEKLDLLVQQGHLPPPAYIGGLERWLVPELEKYTQDGGGKENLVYFMVAGDFVKIGFSTHVNRRKNSIQSACPLPITINHTVSGDIETEGEFHKRFKEYRMHGEWFKIEGKLRAYLKNSGSDKGDDNS